MRTGLLLVFACIFPALVVASLAVYESYVIQKERIFRDTIFLARNLTAILDRELTAVEAGMQMLASSPDLVAGDLPAFHQRARDAVRFQIADSYVLTDRAGRQVLNTLVPYGTSLPMSRVPRDLDRVFESRAPVLSGLFTGAVSGSPRIALGVPVLRGEDVIYSLNVGLSPERIGAVLGRRSLPEGWVAAVLDSSGTIVARTRDTAKFVGQKAVPALARAVQDERGFAGDPDQGRHAGLHGLQPFRLVRMDRGGRRAHDPGDHGSLSFDRLDRARHAGGLRAGLVAGLETRQPPDVGRAGTGRAGAGAGAREGRPVEVPRTHVKEAVEVGTALQQASRMLAHAQHLAHYDPLTGLCNRVLFGELVLRELAVAQRSGASFAILAIDLDGFKAVNDMHGHAAGDTVLKEAADRMANAIRVSDVAARLGGDEFAILLLAGNRESAQAVAEALVETCRCPMPTSGSRCRPVWASPSTRNRARPCCSCSSAPMWPCTRPRGWASAGSHPTCERSGGRLAGAVNWLNCPALASRLFGELAVMSGAQRKSQLKSVIGIASSRNAATLSGLAAVALWGTVVGLIRGVSENFGPIGERR